MSRTPSVDHGAELARGALVNAVAMVAANFRGVFTFLVARLLGRVTLGTFSIAWAVTDLLSKLGVFGLDNSVTIFVARAEAAGDRWRSRALFRAAVGVSVSLSVIVAAVAVVAVRAFGRRFGQPEEVVTALTLVLWAMPGLALYKVGTAASRGMKVMRHDVYSRGLTETVGTSAAFLAAVALGARAAAPEIAAIAGTLACGVVAVWLAASLFTDPAPPFARTTAPEVSAGVTRGLVGYAAPIAGYDLLNTLILNLDLVMLGLFIDRAPGVTLATVGVYAVAVDIGSGLRKISQLFNPIFAPVVAAMADGRQDAQAAVAYGRLARWMLAILLPLVAVMTLGGGALLSIYGPGFRDGALWLGVISIACGTNAFVSLGEVAIMVQRPRLNLLNSTVTCVAAVAVNLWLIPRYGMIGAALGVLLPYGMQGLLRHVELRYLLGWPSQARELTRPIVAAACAAVPAVGCRVYLAGLPGDLISVAAFLAAYTAAWRLLGLDPGDRAIALELTGRRSRPGEPLPI